MTPLDWFGVPLVIVLVVVGITVAALPAIDRREQTLERDEPVSRSTGIDHR